MAKTKTSAGIPEERKKIAHYTLALGAPEIAKLGEFCANASAYERTGTRL